MPRVMLQDARDSRILFASTKSICDQTDMLRTTNPFEPMAILDGIRPRVLR